MLLKCFKHILIVFAVMLSVGVFSSLEQVMASSDLAEAGTSLPADSDQESSDNTEIEEDGSEVFLRSSSELIFFPVHMEFIHSASDYTGHSTTPEVNPPSRA